MFRHSERGTLVWLFIVGLALGMVIAAGEVSNAAGAALLAAYLALVLFVARTGNVLAALRPWADRISHEKEPTEVAREASARARGQPGFDALVRLLDVGLIVDEQRPDGLSLRRGRFVSLDDDGVRPFAIIYVPETLSGRLSRIRLELRDEHDEPQYVFEQDRWVNAGENPLLPDYRFPIRKKATDLQPGGWSAHIYVDGGLLGIHHFNLSPSLAAVRKQMGTDGEILRERVWRGGSEDDESLPLSLEELLRQQSRQQG